MQQRLAQLISVWQVGGGVFGAAVIGWALYHDTVAQPGLAPAIFCLTFYVLCTVAGVLLWRGHPLGFSLSMTAQLLQIPQMAVQGFSFLLLGGIGPQFRLTSALGSFLALSHGSAWENHLPVGPSLAVGINLVALAVFLFLNQARKTSWYARGDDSRSEPSMHDNLSSALARSSLELPAALR